MPSAVHCNTMPELKQVIAEASRALALLDAERLEELAVSCQLFNRQLPGWSASERARIAGQAREATADMAIFARVIDATRANLSVMNRLRELREDALEYGHTLVIPSETGHGND